MPLSPSPSFFYFTFVLGQRSLSRLLALSRSGPFLYFNIHCWCYKICAAASLKDQGITSPDPVTSFSSRLVLFLVSPSFPLSVRSSCRTTCRIPSSSIPSPQLGLYTHTHTHTHAGPTLDFGSRVAPARLEPAEPSQRSVSFQF